MNELLTAALGPIYAWAREEPPKVREVLHSRVLNELRLSLHFETCVLGNWVGLTYFTMYQKINRALVVVVEGLWNESDNDRNRWETVPTFEGEI